MIGRARQAVRVLLQVQDTPHRLALSFALGAYIAFFPIFGIHTGLALLIAYLFRLSRVAILLGAYINNPWTTAPLYLAGTLLGCALLGVSTQGLTEVHWTLHGWAFYVSLLESLRPYLWPFFLGNTVLGVVAGVTGYVGLKSFLERRREAPAQ